jgi:hypothetical protein
MRKWLAWFALIGVLACSDATGGVKGGDPVGPIADAVICSAPDANCATWSYLYVCYFGPVGVAGCSGGGLCHGNPGDTGAQQSGFVCGSTKDECWQGMTHSTGINYATLVPKGFRGIDGTQLWNVLHKEGTSTKNNLLTDNMPLSGIGSPSLDVLNSPASYSFTEADKACLDGWVKAGAKDD